MARRFLLPLLACCIGPWVPAPARAQEQVDIDGDGKLDTVSASDSELRVVPAAGPTLSAPLETMPGARLVRVEAERGVLLVERTGSTGRAAAAFTVVGGRLEPLHAQRTGPTGRDGEWGQELILIRGTLHRYQTRPGLRFCNGRPTMAFFETWARGEFRDRPAPVFLDGNATPLQPTRVTFAEQPAPVAFSFVAASTAASAASARDLTPPVEVNDGDETTVWRGRRGEMLRARQRGRHPVRALVVRHTGPRTELAIEVGERAFSARLPAGPGAYRLELPEPIAADCLTIANAGRRDLAVADAVVVTELELAPGGAAGALVEAIAEGKRGNAGALARLGSEGVQGLLRELAAREGIERGRLRAALAQLALRGVDVGPAGAQALVAGLFDAGASRGQRERIRTALGRIGPAAAPPLARALANDEANRDAATVAVGILDRIPGQRARDALVEAIGYGSKARRRVTVMALARRPGMAEAVLPRLAETENQNEIGRAARRRADLVRALGLAGPGLDSGARAKAAAVLERLYNGSSAGDYELRYRLAGAAARIAEAHELVRAMLDDDSETPRAVALRRVAAARLGAHPGMRGEALLRGALDDADPGVRIAAVASLAEAGGDAPGLDAPLIALLESDPWPRARLAAASALGPRCGRPAPANALLRALREDADAALRINAMTSLVQCRDPRIGTDLVTIARDQSAPMEVRVAAAGLVGKLGDRQLASDAIRTFRLAVDEALGNEYAIRLAEAAATALGDLGDESAADILLAVARDQTFPQIQAAAIRALGKLCVNRATEPLRILERSGERIVSRQATRTLDRCSKP